MTTLQTFESPETADPLAPIRAVIFDFGGVLYKTPDMRWIGRLQRLLGLKNNEIAATLLASPQESQFMHDIMVGKIPEAEVWDLMAARWKINPRLLASIRRHTMSARRLNRKLAKFLTSLRPAYRTAILSNAGTDARHTMLNIYGAEEMVDLIVISAEEGIAKPDERIYHIAAQRLGVHAHECVFLVDLEENVIAARQVGMRAVQYRSAPQAISELQAMLGM